MKNKLVLSNAYKKTLFFSLVILQLLFIKKVSYSHDEM